VLIAQRKIFSTIAKNFSRHHNFHAPQRWNALVHTLSHELVRGPRIDSMRVIIAG
jgi:hypothetical protein